MCIGFHVYGFLQLFSSNDFFVFTLNVQYIDFENKKNTHV